MNQSESRPEDRLEKIEVKLAYLEDFLLRLQEVTNENNAVIGRLGKEAEIIKQKVLQISNDLEEIPDRKPPHY